MPQITKVNDNMGPPEDRKRDGKGEKKKKEKKPVCLLNPQRMKWTSKETTCLIRAINIHGADQQKVAEMVETKSLDQLRIRVNYIKKTLSKNNGTRLMVDGKDCRDILETFNNYEKWTSREVHLFEEGCQLFCKDYKKISQHVKSKTANQVRSRCFFVQSQKDIRMLHIAPVEALDSQQ